MLKRRIGVNQEINTYLAIGSILGTNMCSDGQHIQIPVEIITIMEPAKSHKTWKNAAVVFRSFSSKNVSKYSQRCNSPSIMVNSSLKLFPTSITEHHTPNNIDHQSTKTRNHDQTWILHHFRHNKPMHRLEKDNKTQRH